MDTYLFTSKKFSHDGFADSFPYNRSTFPRPVARTARVKPARSTLNTKSHNTKPAKYDSHTETSPRLQCPRYHILTRFWLGLAFRPRKAPIRPQAVRLWWSNKTRVPQEGEDNQEGRVKIGVHNMQD